MNDENESLIEKIHALRRESDCYIMAHNYQLPEIQDLADFTGDSLSLAQKAATIQNQTVLVCGVYFMAETVCIQNPDKTVMIPDKNAGCPLSDFASEEMILEWRSRYPNHAFITYVNSSAAVKANSDICVTSSNAVKIVREWDNDHIVFLPDKNLGSYVRTQVPEKEIVLWPGFCVVHETVRLDSVMVAKAEHPNALVIAHPECPPEILEQADGICSTGQMISFVRLHDQTDTFIIVTEWGMVHALELNFPQKRFIMIKPLMECRNMKKNTLPKVLSALKSRSEDYIVRVEEEVAKRARRAIDRMLERS